MTAPGTVLVPAALLPHLRKGLREHMLYGLRAMVVLAEMEHVDLAIYGPAEDRYVQAVDILRQIGFTDRSDQDDVRLPVAPWAFLMIKVLDSQGDIEEHRLQLAEQEGLDGRSRAHAEALRTFADELRQHVGATPRGITTPDFSRGLCRRLERRRVDRVKHTHIPAPQIRCSRLPRRRGDGR
jgi:hypothetical protein